MYPMHESGNWTNSLLYAQVAHFIPLSWMCKCLHNHKMVTETETKTKMKIKALVEDNYINWLALPKILDLLKGKSTFKIVQMQGWDSASQDWLHRCSLHSHCRSLRSGWCKTCSCCRCTGAAEILAGSISMGLNGLYTSKWSIATGHDTISN